MAPHNGLRIEQWTFLKIAAQLAAGHRSGAGAAVARHAAHNNANRNVVAPVIIVVGDVPLHRMGTPGTLMMPRIRCCPSLLIDILHISAGR